MCVTSACHKADDSLIPKPGVRHVATVAAVRRSVVSSTSPAHDHDVNSWMRRQAQPMIESPSHVFAPTLLQACKWPLLVSPGHALALVASLSCVWVAFGVNVPWCLFSSICGFMGLLYLSSATGSGRPTSGKLSTGKLCRRELILPARQVKSCCRICVGHSRKWSGHQYTCSMNSASCEGTSPHSLHTSHDCCQVIDLRVFVWIFSIHPFLECLHTGNTYSHPFLQWLMGQVPKHLGICNLANGDSPYSIKVRDCARLSHHLCA